MTWSTEPPKRAWKKGKEANQGFSKMLWQSCSPLGTVPVLKQVPGKITTNQGVPLDQGGHLLPRHVGTVGPGSAVGAKIAWKVHVVSAV